MMQYKKYMKYLTNGYVRENYAGPIDLYPDYVIGISTKFLISDWTASGSYGKPNDNGVHVDVVNPKALRPHFIISVDKFNDAYRLDGGHRVDKKLVIFGPEIQFNGNYRKAFIKFTWSNSLSSIICLACDEMHYINCPICLACDQAIHPWLAFLAIKKPKNKIINNKIYQIIHIQSVTLGACPPKDSIFTLEVDLKDKTVCLPFENITFTSGLENAEKIQLAIAFRSGCSRNETIKILDYGFIY
eukprot:179430_1